MQYLWKKKLKLKFYAKKNKLLIVFTTYRSLYSKHAQPISTDTALMNEVDQLGYDQRLTKLVENITALHVNTDVLFSEQ
jgi:hypothetical protein